MRIAVQVGLWETMDMERMHEESRKALARLNLPEPEHEAACSLLQPGDGTQPSEGGRSFINAQHRTQAMLEASVRLTVVVR